MGARKTDAVHVADAGPKVLQHGVRDNRWCGFCS